MDDLIKTTTSQLHLQCIAACYVVNIGLKYMDVHPSKVSKFVPWHQSDIGSIIHCVDDGIVNDLDLDS